MISPDRTFSETGARSKIDYRDRFKQYKRLIVRNPNTPRMRTFVAQLERQLFQVHSPDNQAAEESDVIDEEDDFCVAFQNEVVLGDPILTSPILVPSLVEPTASLPSPDIPGASLPNPNVPGASLLDPDVPGAPLPTTPAEPLAVHESGEEPANKPTPATRKRSHKKNGEDEPAMAPNNRRSARNGGGTARNVGGGMATKA